MLIIIEHPSVEASHSVGAIGVMAVKKNNDGLWLHFAHNTDSFALASMSSDDVEPWSVMSRSKLGGTSGGNVTSGGRSMQQSSLRRPRSGFKRQKQSKSDPEHSISIAPDTQPVAVSLGTVHPDGGPVNWQPLHESSSQEALLRRPDDDMIG